MNCSSCGHTNREDAAFCGKCGSSLSPATTCSRCGRSNPVGTNFCDGCGQALLETTSTRESSPSLKPGPAVTHPTSFAGGRYEVKRFLGEGGKKRVYLVRDTRLDREVAFALIKTEGLDSEGLLRIRREAQAMAKLGDHPHVVSVFDIGEENGAPYLVSQFMGGGDVEGLVKKAEGHRVPLPQVLKIADQVCQALEHAHKHGIVHRDLKPGNVWLTADGTAKLGDFGLAVVKDKSRLTQEGMMVGTVLYMPPEQAMGGTVTPRADLYSLGAMLYEMVTGRPPFVGDENIAIITQHLNTPPVAPSWHTPDLPPSMEVLILRLLEKDPAKRPGSASEVRSILASIDLSVKPAPTKAPTVGENPVYRRTFVGRERELKQAQALFDAVLSGQGGLLMIVGEAGIGKTAVCEQLATYAAVRGGRTLVGHCYEEGSHSLPYLPFIEAMRSYVISREPDDLRRDLGSGAAEVARIVSDVSQVISIAPASQSTGIDPEQERWRLLQAVGSFLRNASLVQPLLIVLEDLHWADRGTLDLLVHLARNLQGMRLLLVGTYRDIEVERAHPLSSALAELRRVKSFERIQLRGLSAEEVQRMLGAIANQEIVWSFAEAVHRQTEGNPLFVQEVVRYLADEGLIKREGGRWRPTSSTPLEMSIPEGLRDVIGKRLSRLSAECNRVLSIASVIGREFAVQTLQAMAGTTEETLLAALEEAIHIGVLQEESRPGAIRYRFAHAFFRQTLYEEMIAPRRLQLHQQVARALERQYHTRLSDHAAELADHFAHSLDSADLIKAVEYGEMAASRAMSVYAYGEAARLLQQALRVQEVLNPDNEVKQCDLLLALGSALGPGGEPQRVADVVAPETLKLAEALGDHGRASRCCQMALEALYAYGGPPITRSPAWQEWAERADRYAAPGTIERVYADLALCRVRVRERRWAENRNLSVRAWKLAKELGQPDALMHAVTQIILPQMAIQHLTERIGLAEDIVKMPRAGVSTSTLGELLAFSQSIFLAAGERARAEELWRELEELSSQTRDATILLWPLYIESIRLTLDGNLEAVVEARKRIVDRADELGVSVAGRIGAEHLVFRPLLYLGRAEEALANLPEAERLAGVKVFSSTLRFGWSGLCLTHTGRFAEAQTQLTEYLRQMNITAEEDEIPAPILATLLEIAVLVGDKEAAAVLSKRLAGVVAIHATDRTVANVARDLGKAAVLTGDWKGARANYEKALTWATKISHRPEVALTRFGIAEMLLAEAERAKGDTEQTAGVLRSQAQAHLDFAIGEFRSMKMKPALEQALRHKGLLTA